MRSGLIVLAITAIVTGGCSSGALVTNRYIDDIYFDPGMIPPPVALQEIPAEIGGTGYTERSVIVSDVSRDSDGAQTVNNYIFEGSNQGGSSLYYDVEGSSLYSSDTTLYYNDSDVKYVINNYYEGDQIDYAYRIRRFHRPYFYDTFYWDSWYYDPYFYDPYIYSYSYYPYNPYWSRGWAYSWYGPYFGMSWSWNWGWRSPYAYWSNPYYYGYHSYYPGYYGGSYWYGHGNNWQVDSRQYDYGRRRTGSTSVVQDGGRNQRPGGGAVNRPVENQGAIGSSTAVSPSRSSVDRTTPTNANRSSTTRSADGAGRTSTDNGVAVERRRAGEVSSSSVGSARTGGQAVRSTTTQSPVNSSTESSSVTKTYTRPATHTSVTPRVVTQPRTTETSGNPASGSVSTYNRTYRTTSTYNRSASGSSSTGTYTAPASSTVKSAGTTIQRTTPSTGSRSTPATPSTPSSSGSYRSSSPSSTPSSSGSYSPSSSGSSSGRSAPASAPSSSSGRRR